MARVAGGVVLALLAANLMSCVPTVRLSAAAQARFREGPPIRVFHWAPKPLGRVDNPLNIQADYYRDVEGADDPGAEVERAFLDLLRGELGFTNLEPSPRPMWDEARMRPRGVTWERAAAAGASRAGLPAEFYGEGLLLALVTQAWDLDASGPKKLIGRCDLRLVLLAQLYRFPDGPNLWTGTCVCEQSRACSEFTRDGFEGVKALSPLLAQGCAELLGAAFAGRSPRGTPGVSCR